MQSIELKAMSAAHALEQNGFDHTPVLEILQQRAELLEALKAYHKAYDENPHLGPRGSQVDQAFVMARDIITKAEAAE